MTPEEEVEMAVARACEPLYDLIKRMREELECIVFESEETRVIGEYVYYFGKEAMEAIEALIKESMP